MSPATGARRGAWSKLRLKAATWWERNEVWHGAAQEGPKGSTPEWRRLRTDVLREAVDAPCLDLVLAHEPEAASEKALDGFRLPNLAAIHDHYGRSVEICDKLALLPCCCHSRRHLITRQASEVDGPSVLGERFAHKCHQ